LVPLNEYYFDEKIEEKKSYQQQKEFGFEIQNRKKVPRSHPTTTKKK
jgi:hypothetical protein